VEIVVINRNETDPYVRIRAALKDTRKVMSRIGETMEAASFRAFDEQAFGDFKWPARYPDQPPPFLNVAGAIADFAKGATAPKARRFQNRPALIDTGALSTSPKSRVVGNRVVEVGSTHPAAASHQWGLPSSQPVDQATKNRIARWLLKKGKPYRNKLAPVLMPSVSSWGTKVAQRPFLGVPHDLEPEIQSIVETEIAGAARDVGK